MASSGSGQFFAMLSTVSALVSAGAAAVGLYYNNQVAAKTDEFNRNVQATQWRKDWQDAYTVYKTARNTASYYELEGKGKSKDELQESNAVYGARVGRWYDAHCFPPSAPDKKRTCSALEDMRSAARQLLVGLRDSHRNEAYLAEQGWAEALNVFFVNAPMDAVNYKRIQQRQGHSHFGDVQLHDFGAVVMLLLASGNDASNLRALDKLYATDSGALYNKVDLHELRTQLEQAVTTYPALPNHGGFHEHDMQQLQTFLEQRRRAVD